MRYSTVGRPRILTDEQVQEVLDWYEESRRLKAERKKVETVRQLASRLRAKPGTVYDVIRRREQFKRPPRTRV